MQRASRCTRWAARTLHQVARARARPCTCAASHLRRNAPAGPKGTVPPRLSSACSVHKGQSRSLAGQQFVQVRLVAPRACYLGRTLNQPARKPYLWPDPGSHATLHRMRLLTLTRKLQSAAQLARASWPTACRLDAVDADAPIPPWATLFVVSSRAVEHCAMAPCCCSNVVV